MSKPPSPFNVRKWQNAFMCPFKVFCQHCTGVGSGKICENLSVLTTIMTRNEAKLRNVRNIVVMQREKFVREANLVSEETENVCEVFQNTSSFPDARLTCETFPERLYREIIFADIVFHLS